MIVVQLRFGYGEGLGVSGEYRMSLLSKIYLILFLVLYLSSCS